MRLMVKIHIIAQKKERNVTVLDQKEAPSSNVNRTPPTGALNAAATPAAAPNVTKSRFIRSLRRSWNFVHEISVPKRKVFPCDKAAPTTDPQ